MFNPTLTINFPLEFGVHFRAKDPTNFNNSNNVYHLNNSRMEDPNKNPCSTWAPVLSDPQTHRPHPHNPYLLWDTDLLHLQAHHQSCLKVA